ncbi:MAG: hypothetical protein U5K71_09925 [Gracilimonas sp.]|nr:hypothetical protein [Gracilimonas sp.]
MGNNPNQKAIRPWIKANTGIDSVPMSDTAQFLNAVIGLHAHDQHKDRKETTE